MTYQNKLESLIEEILNEFEDDPVVGWIHYGMEDEPSVCSDELQELLDRANDLIYGSEEEENELES
jgi:hypothetical protein